MMGNVFAITAASEQMTLKDGQGEIVFNVHNRTDRAIRALAGMEVLGDTKAEWLRIDGEPERQFASGESQQYRVRLATPAGTKPGSYTFRLRVASTSRPDEDFEEGPVVTAKLEAAHEPDPKRPIGLIIALAVAVLVIGGFATWYFLRDDGIEVPHVVGKQIEAARLEMSDKTFSVVVLATPLQPGLPEGQVTGQSLEGGSEAEPFSTVELTAATASPVEVPDVLSKPLANAVEILNGVGLSGVWKDSVPEGDGASPGDVSKQVPQPGEEAVQGTVVELTVAEALVEVPRVIGLDTAQATRKLRAVHLDIGAIWGQRTNEAIIKQQPDEGARIPKGKRVDVTVPGDPRIAWMAKHRVDVEAQPHIINRSRLGMAGAIGRDVPSEVAPELTLEDLDLKQVR